MSEQESVIDVVEGRDYEIDLYDDRGPKGEVRTDQPALHDSYTASGFTIKIRCTHELHGCRKGSSLRDLPQASIVVVKFTFGAKDDDWKRFYRLFVATLTFKSDPPGNAVDDPSVLDFEPGGKGALRITHTSAKITKETNYEASADLKAGGGPASGGAGTKTSRKKGEEYDQQSAYTVQADTDKSEGGGRERDNMVQWVCRADPRQTHGVGDAISLAILIERPDPQKLFVVDLDLEATVDWKYWIANKWKEVFGRKKKAWKSLRFNPEIGGKAIPDFDANNLEASAEKHLWKLGYVHVPEHMAPRTFYECGMTLF